MAAKSENRFSHTHTHRYRMPDIKHTSTTMRISELCDFWIFWEENMGKTKKTHGNGLKRIATDWSAWRMGGKHREGWLRWWEAKQAFVYHENNNNECVRGQSTNWNYVNSFGGGVFVCVCVCVCCWASPVRCVGVSAMTAIQPNKNPRPIRMSQLVFPNRKFSAHTVASEPEWMGRKREKATNSVAHRIAWKQPKQTAQTK